MANFFLLFCRRKSLEFRCGVSHPKRSILKPDYKFANYIIRKSTDQLFAQIHGLTKFVVKNVKNKRTKQYTTFYELKKGYNILYNWKYTEFLF